jgi:hypothetical protein
MLMDKDYAVVENYLSMLGGESNVIYMHAVVDEESETISIATVTDLGTKYLLMYSVGAEVVINRTYPSLNTITRILKDLQPN